MQYKGFDVLDVLRSGRGSRPHVYKVRYRDTEAVLKDFDGCDPWFARAFGGLLAGRESTALNALAEHPAVPDLFERVGKRALLMQYLDASPAVRVDQGSIRSVDWRLFLSRLEEVVTRMHQLGVAHGDLRSPMNILITRNNKPVVVDFTGAFLRKGLPLPGRTWMFSKLVGVDTSAVTKLALKVCPDSVSEADKTAYQRRGFANRSTRQFGKLVRRLSRWLTRSGD